MLIACPECSRQVSSEAPACPGCGFPLGDAAVPQTPVAAKPFKAVKKTEQFGLGVVVQFVGFLLLGIPYALPIESQGVQLAAVAGVLLCVTLPLVIFGGRMARRYECSNCSARVASSSVARCDVCGANAGS